MENLKNKLKNLIYSNFDKILVFIFFGFVLCVVNLTLILTSKNKPITNKQDSLKVFIKQKELQIDTVVKTKEKIVIKNKTIIIKLKHEDSVITNTPDSNITKLFSELSKKLDTTSSK